MEGSKQNIIDALRRKLAKELESAEKQIERNVSHSKDAPGAMQSHHDWDKDQYGKLADQLKDMVVDLQSNLEVLDRLEVGGKPTKKIRVCSLVEVDLGVSTKRYFVLPFGGEKVEVDPFGMVLVVSSESPAGSALLGRKKGDVVKIGSHETKILDIS